MRAVIPSSLFFAVGALTVMTAATPTAKPEEVGLSSERLQRIGQSLQRRIDAKPVIGVSIMMMVEEGKLRLNDPVSRFIPEFHVMKVGADRVAAQRDITVKDLLTHVSGLGSGPVGGADIAKVARQEGETLADYIVSSPIMRHAVPCCRTAPSAGRARREPTSSLIPKSNWSGC
jgi:hypothetical protein